MKWVKRGRIYVPPGDVEWAQHYAFPPTPVFRADGVLRLYVAFCDADTVGRVGYVDVRADSPGEIVEVSTKPVLDIGEPGMFDENGVVPTCIIPVGDRLFMYYVGYQVGSKVKYFQFQGLAISTDGGETFERAQRVPVLERSDAEPLNRTSAFVRSAGDAFQMWYVGGGEWTEVGGKPLPIYNLRYLESPDGIVWGDEGRVCLDFANEDEHAFGRPWVWEEAGGLTMMYSIRTRSKDYRLGLARSPDGLVWERHDEEVGIDVSPDGWDAEMIAYGSVVQSGESTYLFYNGNERGRTGFGFAELAASG
jgi:sucrose-6-phosphate hydrolase SacC (GH32 family)